MTLLRPMTNPIRSYAWGSREVLARLQVRTFPTASPEAELWMGAHPTAPSTVVVGGVARRLDEVIAADPHEELGTTTVGRHGPRLPFLLKVLAIDAPLSLQVHPSAAQALAGFEDEERRGVPVTAPARNYRDPHPKPELLVALSPVEAFVGVRPAAEISSFADRLQLTWLREVIDASDGTDLVARILRTPADHVTALQSRTVSAARQAIDAGDPESDLCRWLIRLSDAYPGDAGVLLATALRFLRLAPGQGVRVPAGRLHAYLSGTAVEIMAASDNVLRAGLTTKHVDVEELLAVLDPRPSAPAIIAADPTRPEPQDFRLPEAGLRLTLRVIDSDATIEPSEGPQVLLCVEGRVTASAGGATEVIGAGHSVFVPASAGAVSLSGRGTLYAASTC
jgi:mannose-6-phosphate isomerase